MTAGLPGLGGCKATVIELLAAFHVLGCRVQGVERGLVLGDHELVVARRVVRQRLDVVAGFDNLGGRVVAALAFVAAVSETRCRAGRVRSRHWHRAPWNATPPAFIGWFLYFMMSEPAAPVMALGLSPL